MYNKKPPFEITNSILEEIAEIAELIGHVSATAGLSTTPMLCCTNRIRSVYSSLAIEQNTLSQEQVTAVLNANREYYEDLYEESGLVFTDESGHRITPPGGIPGIQTEDNRTNENRKRQQNGSFYPVCQRIREKPKPLLKIWKNPNFKSGEQKRSPRIPKKNG